MEKTLLHKRVAEFNHLITFFWKKNLNSQKKIGKPDSMQNLKKERVETALEDRVNFAREPIENRSVLH